MCIGSRSIVCKAQFRYSPTLVDIPSIELDVPAGSVTLTGSFTHPANDFNAGSVKLNLRSSDIQIAKIEHVQQEKPDLAGTLRLAADLSANLREQNGSRTILFSNLNADASATALRMNSRNLGDANFTARTSGSNLNFKFDSDIAQSQIHASGDSQLTGDYPVRATLTFANIKYSNIAPFISSEPNVKPSFDALVEGQASVNGPILETDQFNARLQLTRLEAQTIPQRSATGAPPGKAVQFHNQGSDYRCLESLRRANAAVQHSGTRHQHQGFRLSQSEERERASGRQHKCQRGSGHASGRRSRFLFFRHYRRECHRTWQLFATAGEWPHRAEERKPEL